MCLLQDTVFHPSKSGLCSGTNTEPVLWESSLRLPPTCPQPAAAGAWAAAAFAVRLLWLLGLCWFFLLNFILKLDFLFPALGLPGVTRGWLGESGCLPARSAAARAKINKRLSLLLTLQPSALFDSRQHRVHPPSFKWLFLPFCTRVK